MSNMYNPSKDKLLGTLALCDDDFSFIDILKRHIYLNPEDFGSSEILRILKILFDEFTKNVEDLETIRFVANERAGYIKRYLEGKMFNSEEEAKKHVDCQIDNAKAILDICKK